MTVVRNFPSRPRTPRAPPTGDIPTTKSPVSAQMVTQSSPPAAVCERRSHFVFCWCVHYPKPGESSFHIQKQSAVLNRCTVVGELLVMAPRSSRMLLTEASTAGLRPLSRFRSATPWWRSADCNEFPSAAPTFGAPHRTQPTSYRRSCASWPSSAVALLPNRS